MHHFEPRYSHPALWALTTLLGVSHSQINADTGIARPTLLRIEQGHRVDGRKTHALVEYLKQHEKRHAKESAEWRRAQHSSYTPDEMFEAHDLHTRTLIVGIIDRSQPRVIPDAPDDTKLSLALKAILFPTGDYVEDVIRTLRKTGRTAQSVRKCALRIGVKLSSREGRPLWLLPDAPPPSDGEKTFPMPHAVAIMPPKRSPAHQRYLDVQQFIATAQPTAGRPHASRWLAEIEGRFLGVKGFSRNLLHRIARDLRFIRTQSGFGRSKRALWSLSPVKSEHK